MMKTFINSTTVRRGRDRMVVGFIITNVLSSNSARAIQHHVIKFVSDLRQVGGFLRFPPPIKLTSTI